MKAEEEKELLLRVTWQVAQKQLETGNRMHFGAVLGSLRDVRLLIPKSIKAGATWDELDAYWRRELCTAAAVGEWRAVSSCVFADLRRSDGVTAGKALFIHIEHPDVGAEDVIYPYGGDDPAKIQLGEPTREAARPWILRLP